MLTQLLANTIMRSIAIVSTGVEKQIKSAGGTVWDIIINNQICKIAYIETERPLFDPDADNFSDLIFIRKIAFSLNFRDRGIISQKQEMFNKHPAAINYSPIGSDFVAEVVMVGYNVRHLQIGDRVIPNCSYPNENTDAPDGIPTNEASKEFQVLHHASVLKISDNLPNDIAAGFSVSAQTSYSILRRLQLKGNERILITSGSSNTSLSVLKALVSARGHQNVTVMTSRKTEVQQFQRMGLQNIILIEDRNNFNLDHAFSTNVKQFGFFDIVIDPFADMHLLKLVNYMSFNGRYVTCGFYHQSKREIPEPGVNGENLTYLLTSMISRNIQLIGNCLGSSADLEHALSDYKNGIFSIYTDQVYRDGDVEGFVKSSFSDTQKFGKIVYMF